MNQFYYIKIIYTKNNVYKKKLHDYSNKINNKKKLRTTRRCIKCKNKIPNIGGSSIYNDGEITHTDLTYNGEQFFRKMFYYSHPPKMNEKKVVNAETKIVNILQLHKQHPNIVKYFDINKRYVDMEEIDTKNIDLNEAYEAMKHVKDFLQSLGIMYIDWKIDNIGKGKDGKYKLFDFDSSGIIDVETNEWILKPMEFWSYKEAIKRGNTNPIEIDNWAFNHNIKSKSSSKSSSKSKSIQ